MSNNDLIFKINDEIDRCNGEIRKADDTIIRMQERRLCYDMRKTMLEELLDVIEVEPIKPMIDIKGVAQKAIEALGEKLTTE